MRDIDKNVATIRGEAIAANILAGIVLQMMIGNRPDKDTILNRIEAFANDTVNNGRFGTTIDDDEFSAMIRETARAQILQHLDGIRKQP